MSRASPIQTNFTAGELSPRLMARVDISKYNNGCRQLTNMLVMPHGGVTRRQGTRYVAEVKSSAKDTCLIPFIYSTTQAYVIEMGDLYFRFFTNEGVLGAPYEIAHPYPVATIRDVGFTQSADVLYLLHRSYRPKKLLRASSLSWSVVDLDFLDGPYFDANVDATYTLTPAATTGTNILVTASKATFASTDVGRLIRIKNGTNWGYAKIVTYNTTTTVHVDIKKDFGATTAATNWCLGSWSDTTGWPSCATFHQDRLWFGGTAVEPDTVYASKTGDYENFAPTALDGTVAADNGLVLTVTSDTVNDIRHLNAGKNLSVLTNGGEFTVGASSLSEAITPTNARFVRETTRGCAKARPVRVDAILMFWQASGRKLREFQYSFQSDSYVAPDITILSEHISLGGILDMDYQQEPNSILWSVRNDGVLLGCTYNKEQDVVGWHKHPIAGTNAKVKAVAVIPDPTATYDQLWMIVERTINGSTKKYVEFLTKEIEPTGPTDKDNLFFMDSGLTYTGVSTTTISGLTHLIGETVDVVANGAVQPSKVVSGGGTITLSIAATVVNVGLHYRSLVQPVRPEVGGNEGTSQAKMGRIHHLAVRFHNTLGAKIGPSETRLEEVAFRSTSDPMDKSPPLFTGDKLIPFDGDYDTDRFMFIIQDQPYPMTVLGIMPQMVVYE